MVKRRRNDLGSEQLPAQGSDPMIMPSIGMSTISRVDFQQGDFQQGDFQQGDTDYHNSNDNYFDEHNLDYNNYYCNFNYSDSETMVNGPSINCSDDDFSHSIVRAPESIASSSTCWDPMASLPSPSSLHYASHDYLDWPSPLFATGTFSGESGLTAYGEMDPMFDQLSWSVSDEAEAEGQQLMWGYSDGDADGLFSQEAMQWDAMDVESPPSMYAAVCTDNACYDDDNQQQHHHHYQQQHWPLQPPLLSTGSPSNSHNNDTLTIDSNGNRQGFGCLGSSSDIACPVQSSVAFGAESRLGGASSYVTTGATTTDSALLLPLSSGSAVAPESLMSHLATLTSPNSHTSRRSPRTLPKRGSRGCPPMRRPGRFLLKHVDALCSFGLDAGPSFAADLGPRMAGFASVAEAKQALIKANAEAGYADCAAEITRIRGFAPRHRHS